MVELTVRLSVQLTLHTEDENVDMEQFIKYLRCEFYPDQDDIDVKDHQINDYEVVDMSYL
jgi:hypothetical protein